MKLTSVKQYMSDEEFFIIYKALINLKNSKLEDEEQMKIIEELLKI